MKRNLCLILTAALLFSGLATSVLANPTVKVILNGTELVFDVQPYLDLETNRVMVPFRTLFESLGAAVDWEEATQTATAVKDRTIIQFTIGSAVAKVDNRLIRLDTPAAVLAGRTMVPLRFAAGTLGAAVRWDESYKTAYIKTLLDSYPPKTDAALTWWMPLNGYVAASANSMNGIPLTQYLEEDTGVSIEYIHPRAGQVTESFNIMIASRNLPDIIEADWYSYKGGPSSAISDKTIYPLDSLLEKHSPNYKQFLDQHPQHANYVKTDAGDIFTYAFARNLDETRSFMGFMVRKDYLEKTGLQAPETIPEWDAMLRAFKELGVESPLNLSLNTYSMNRSVSPFTSAYDFVLDFYVDGGKVKFGPHEKAFGDYVTQMHIWYKDGLLDKNSIGPQNYKTLSAGVTSGKIGAAPGYAVSEFLPWHTELTAKTPGADFVPVKYPAKTKGEVPFYGQKEQIVSGQSVAITTACKNKEIAARVLDYGYSEKGRMLYTYGREGISYEMADGVPRYVSALLDPTRNGGLAPQQALSKYTRAPYRGPFYAIRSEKDTSLEETYPKAVRDAPGVWSQTDADNHMLPPLDLTPEENKEFLDIKINLELYYEEMLHKFISGSEPLESLDQYFEQLRTLGVERAIEIQQTAYDRFMSR